MSSERLEPAFRTSVAALVLLVLLLFVGTQMPGAWRDEAFRVTHLPWQLTKVAHFVVFALIAAVASARPLCFGLVRVLAGALVLAVATEGLQFWASNRSPSLADVGIDMAGAMLGVLLVMRVTTAFKSKQSA